MWLPMVAQPNMVLHPRLDGSEDQERFLNLLLDSLRSAANGKKRAELRQLQQELFKRGWHP
jgi:hypothetical protein